MRTLRFAGPWLLERMALEELSAVVEDLWQRYGPGEAEADSYSITKRVRIGKKGTDIVTAPSVEEAIRLQSQGSKVANTLHVELRTKNEYVELEIENEILGGSVLTLSGDSPGTIAAGAMFGAFRNWVEDHRAPLWQRIWTWLPPWHWLAWWFGLFILVALTPAQSAKSALEEQATAILKDGISAQETEKAIEILLRIETDLVPDEMKPTKPRPWLKPYLFLGLSACVVLSFRPKVVLGIGSGVSLLRRWKLWTKLVGISIPALVFGSFVWPRMEVAIRSLFSS